MIHNRLIAAALTIIIFLLLPAMDMSRIEAVACIYFIYSVCLCLIVWLDEVVERRQKHNGRDA